MHDRVSTGQPSSVWRRSRRRLGAAGALAIVAATVAIAPAVADNNASPGQIFINNVPFNNNGAHGEPVLVDAASEGCNPPSEFPGGQACVYVDGSFSPVIGPTRDGDPFAVTFVAGVIDSSTVTIKSAQALWTDPRYRGDSVKEPCDITASASAPTPGSTFTCQATPQVFGQQFYAVGLTFSDPSYNGNWKEIHLSGNYFPCKAGGRAASPSVSALAAAADPCAPPSPPKITFAQVNERKRSAVFKFKAQHATQYTCVLTRGGQIVFHRACTSPRPFPGPLKPGQYVFILQAGNDGGVAMHSAVKQFTIR